MTKSFKRNSKLLITHMLVCGITLMGWLIFVTGSQQGFDPQLFKKGYGLFWIFQVLVYTLVVSFVKTKDCDNFGKEILSQAMEAGIFTIVTLPYLLVFLVLGYFDVNILKPMFIQLLWGVFVISLRKGIYTKCKDEKIKGFYFNLIIFLLIVMTLVFLYFYITYKSAVITTVYDKDIPIIFFINPLLTISGIVHTQIGGKNYLGLKPIIIFTIFIVTMCFVLFKLRLKGEYLIANTAGQQKGSN